MAHRALRRFPCTPGLSRPSRTCGRKLSRALAALVLPLSITLFGADLTPAAAQKLTKLSPPQITPPSNLPQPPTQSPVPPPETLPDDPAAGRFPIAQIVSSTSGTPVSIESRTQTRTGTRYILEGDVVVRSGLYSVQADHIDYDSASGDITADGHLHLAGGPHQEQLTASRGTVNLQTGAGRFYDVSGSIGIKANAHNTVYTVGNPFLFTGRMVVRNGPENYEIYDGTVTSCALPHPDWRLSSAKFLVHDGSARAYNSTFRLLNIPILYLPFVSHAVDADNRQSGFLIPVISQSSTKGFIFGEEFFLAINRSMDLTGGLEYFSRRGYSESAIFRYKGPGLDFIDARVSALQDRGYTSPPIAAGGTLPPGSIVRADGTIYTNQGGQDVNVSGRKDFGEHTRVAANTEYLSSYVYREAFNNNFNQAVSSDITSTVYGVHDFGGVIAGLRFDRYQGLKDVVRGSQVRIFHTPSLDLDVIERHIGRSPLVFSMEDSIASLKRVQPNFSTNGVSERVDFHPRVSLPLSLGQWRFRPSLGLRDTYYTASRQPTPVPGSVPSELNASTNRATFEAEGELRAPVIERTFDTPALARLLSRRIKHTVEASAHYRFVGGVDNFNSIIRFDPTDVVSNTNEIEYGVTQHLFLQPTKLHDCKPGETPVEEGGQCGGTRESLRWRLSQKHFFDPNFGGVIVNNGRNVLQTTLDFSGVAFLTDPREISPILSEMRLSATDKFDIEWDMNYDTHAGRFTASNVYLNYHQSNYFAAIGEARLNAPGRFNTGGVASRTSDFNQLRILLGYGNPNKPGLSVAANAGLDLKNINVQYGVLQTAYNWNCCGVSIEYRKFELGPVRNENVYRFNFTLANIGSAGNLKRIDRLF